jgi:phosphoenolpyruvate synthase/pyruvate phosphate dikinase
MFMAADRQPKMQAMIMAESTDDRRARRSPSCLPLQREDFEGLFEEMADLPVHDPAARPAAARVPPDGRGARGRARARPHERPGDVRRLERTLDRVRSLEETNPMLGTRGARLGDHRAGDLRRAGRGDHHRRPRGTAKLRPARRRSRSCCRSSPTSRRSGSCARASST